MHAARWSAQRLSEPPLGARLLALLEHPQTFHWRSLVLLDGGRTIIGGILGGWITVELVKRKYDIHSRTGDLFVRPLAVGLIFGRIGCFLAGTADDTFGRATTLPWGVDFGDGLARHPLQLYEIAFLLLFLLLSRELSWPLVTGDRFRLFVFSYFSLRFALEFLQDSPRVAGLDALQWASLAGMLWCAPAVLAIARRRLPRALEASLTDRVRPYLFYDVAISICSRCFRKVEGKIVFQDGKVLMLKRCPQHGARRVLMADDVDYYRRCREVFIKPPEMPDRLQHAGELGLPYDCGLCTDHEQHSCLTLVEITDSLQSALPDLLRRQRPGAPDASRSLEHDRAHAGRRGAQRAASRTSCRSPAASRRCIRISSRSSMRAKRGRSAT